MHHHAAEVEVGDRLRGVEPVVGRVARHLGATRGAAVGQVRARVKIVGVGIGLDGLHFGHSLICSSREGGQRKKRVRGFDRHDRAVTVGGLSVINELPQGGGVPCLHAIRRFDGEAVVPPSGLEVEPVMVAAQGHDELSFERRCLPPSGGIGQGGSLPEIRADDRRRAVSLERTGRALSVENFSRPGPSVVGEQMVGGADLEDERIIFVAGQAWQEIEVRPIGPRARIMALEVADARRTVVVAQGGREPHQHVVIRAFDKPFRCPRVVREGVGEQRAAQFHLGGLPIDEVRAAGQPEGAVGAVAERIQGEVVRVYGDKLAPVAHDRGVAGKIGQRRCRVEALPVQSVGADGEG